MGICICVLKVQVAMGDLYINMDQHKFMGQIQTLIFLQTLGSLTVQVRIIFTLT